MKDEQRRIEKRICPLSKIDFSSCLMFIRFFNIGSRGLRRVNKFARKASDHNHSCNNTSCEYIQKS